MPQRPLAAVVEPMESRRLLSAVSPVESEPIAPPLPAGLEQARYLRRTDNDLTFWATPDGSGAPLGTAPLPLDADLAFAGTDDDDVITIDMSGGDIVVQGNLVLSAGAGDDRVRLTNGDGRRLTLGAIPQLNGKKLDAGTADIKLVGTSDRAVEGLLGTARNDGTVRWKGPGIGTSAATPVTGLAPIQQGADTLIKYTYNGDVNGDGKVNADDYFEIDSGFPEDVRLGYRWGDFNFDGRINADDYFLIDYAFLAQGEPLGQGDSAATAASDAEVRYLKRVGDELHAWANESGTGAPLWTRGLPLAGDLSLGGTDGDDVITIDMSGGDIVVQGNLVLGASAGDDRIRLLNGDGRTLTLGAIPQLNGKTLDLGTADVKLLGVQSSAVERLVGSARNDGTVRWQGPGIGTSAATPVTGLAPIQEGIDTLIKYTYNGDANGDGKINADDYFTIDTCFLAFCNRGYRQGDFNFDDRKNADDYFLIDYAFLAQGEPLGQSDSAAAAASDAEVRFLKRVGDELHAWANETGSGAPLWTRTLPLAGDLSLGGSDGDETVTFDMSGGDIVIDGTLAIAASAGDDRIRLTNGDGRLLTLGGVELNGKKLDLGTADLLIRDADIYAVEDLVGSARNGTPRWMGPGIGSSSTRPGCTGLAPRQIQGDVFITHTYHTDVNQDGRVNADDYFQLDLGFLLNLPRPSYFEGDTNFDDRVDADDYFMIDALWIGGGCGGGQL